MTQYKSIFLQSLSQRGLLNQITHPNKLDQILSNQKITAYIGFDCTAKSLHIGSLIQIMILRQLQKAGHQAIILLGGATTKIGDPSGKDKSREILNEEIINKNLISIKEILTKFDLSIENPTLPKFKFVNNEDWLDNLNYIEFLRDIGHKFSINKMLGFDSVKSRLDREQNLSFLEFNYLILQSYDFLELHKRHNCILQIGGSDQWGNIVSGIDLIHKSYQKNQNAFGLTSPLLTNSEGKKMGKTADGAIWLHEKILSPYDYFQYFRNIKDEDVIRFLYYFTDLTNDEISNYQKLQGEDINKVKEILAFNVTKICHGKKMAEQSLQKAQEIFLNKNENSFEEVKINIGKKILDLIVEINAAESKSKARKLITSGAVKINKEKLLNKNHAFKKAEELILSVGKKKFFKIIILP